MLFEKGYPLENHRYRCAHLDLSEPKKPLNNHLQGLWPGLAGAQPQHLGQLVTSLWRPGDVTPMQRPLVTRNLVRKKRQQV